MAGHAVFEDRQHAGRALAGLLEHHRGTDAVVLGLPRGGVPVAAEVARALHLPLDVVIVRKLGVPWQPELGMGAIGEGGARVVQPEIVRLAGVTDDALAAVEARERHTLDERAVRYRTVRPRLALDGRTAIVVDDGIATGGTVLAAVQVVRALHAAQVVVAVPVAPPDTVAALRAVADEVVAVRTPEHLDGVGAWYLDFRQTTDEEVLALLAEADPPPAR